MSAKTKREAWLDGATADWKKYAKEGGTELTVSEEIVLDEALKAIWDRVAVPLSKREKK